jgi:hypothetical protein
MEYTIDVDLIGEILIPLENTKNKSNLIKTFTNLEDLLNSNFNSFRSIIFQGEVLRVFIVMKIDTQKNIEKLLEETYFKIEFDHFSNNYENKKSENNNNEYQENDYEFPNENNNLLVDNTFSRQSDLFSIHRKTIFNNEINNSKECDYKNLSYEFITRKIYIKEKKIAIFEILKHISKIKMIILKKYLFY